MKIGIITWFRYENFGTALQAIALQKYLKKMGHEVELIDYRIPTPKNNRPSSRRGLYEIFGMLLLKVDGIIHKKEYIEKSKKFEKFIQDNGKISKYVKNESEYTKLCNSYDLLVFGSDQIWNPNWYNHVYYANFDGIKAKRISYAPSFGVSDVEGEDMENIKKALNRFNKLAVREKSGVEIVEKLIKKTPEIVADPTLLLEKKEWKEFESPKMQKEKYILFYMLTDNHNHFKAIERFAKEKELKLITLPHNGHSMVMGNVIRDVGPSEFLSLLHNAEYVVTDSYHALILSIIYKKKMILFERHDPNLSGAENSRIYSLLNIAGINNILIPFNANHIIEKRVDYEEVDNKLKKLIEKSKKYLKESIK